MGTFEEASLVWKLSFFFGMAKTETELLWYGKDSFFGMAKTAYSFIIGMAKRASYGSPPIKATSEQRTVRTHIAFIRASPV